MQKVEWPELQLSLSKLAFGCAPVMGRVGRKQALDAMALAYEHGVTHFDVARAYGFGEAERVLGRFIADKRDKTTIATKFGILPARVGRAVRMLKPVVRTARQWVPGLAGAVRKASGAMLTKGYYGLDEAQRSIETSLRELNTEVIDILFVHECSSDDDIQPALVDFLDRLCREGKIRAWGLATHAKDIEQVSQKMGESPKIIQYAWGDQPPHFGATTRRIIHSPISYTSRLYAPDGSLLPWVVSWGKSHDIQAVQLPQLLPALALGSAAIENPDSVILCSMFRRSSVLSNVQALADNETIQELSSSFLRTIRSTGELNTDTR